MKSFLNFNKRNMKRSLRIRLKRNRVWHHVINEWIRVRRWKLRFESSVLILKSRSDDIFKLESVSTIFDLLSFFTSFCSCSVSVRSYSRRFSSANFCTIVSRTHHPSRRNLRLWVVSWKHHIMNFDSLSFTPPGKNFSVYEVEDPDDYQVDFRVIFICSPLYYNDVWGLLDQFP